MILNVYTPDDTQTAWSKNWYNWKGEIDKSEIIVENFNSPITLKNEGTLRKSAKT